MKILNSSLKKAYIISDTHFGHEVPILKERYGIFSNTEEHDEYIVSTLNKLLNQDSILIHLGDVGDLETMSKVHGRKVLIKGNHDKLSNKKYLEVFEEIYNQPVFLNKRILLSHYPEMVSPHVLNIHGHLHASYLDSKNHMTASIHMINYKPLTLRQVQSYIDKQLPKHETEFLYEWYADKQIFTERSRSDLVLDENGKIDLERTRELYKTTRGDRKEFLF